MSRCPSDLGLKDGDKCFECQDCWEKALDDILETFEELTEEVENLYGREVEITKRAREILEQIAR